MSNEYEGWLMDEAQAVLLEICPTIRHIDFCAKLSKNVYCAICSDYFGNLSVFSIKLIDGDWHIRRVRI